MKKRAYEKEVMDMFEVFGEGRCPICGGVAKNIKGSLYFCERCEIHFGKFGIPKTESNILEALEKRNRILEFN